MERRDFLKQSAAALAGWKTLAGRDLSAQAKLEGAAAHSPLPAVNTVNGICHLLAVVDALPASIRSNHDPHTVAQALASSPGRASDVIAAFVAGTDAGLRVIGLAVLVLGLLVTLESRLSRR